MFLEHHCDGNNGFYRLFIQVVIALIIQDYGQPKTLIDIFKISKDMVISSQLIYDF